MLLLRNSKNGNIFWLIFCRDILYEFQIYHYKIKLSPPSNRQNYSIATHEQMAHERWRTKLYMIFRIAMMETNLLTQLLYSKSIFLQLFGIIISINHQHSHQALIYFDDVMGNSIIDFIWEYFRNLAEFCSSSEFAIMITYFGCIDG